MAIINGMPCLFQTVIFRNYGMVPTENIAKVIKCSNEQVIKCACDLGLSEVEYDCNWLKKGFVTVIRNNWDLISNKDISVLLGISESELNAILKDYDFLDIKLGDKPKIYDYTFTELSEEQLLKTKKIKELVLKNYEKSTVKPFDFYCNTKSPYFDGNGEFQIKDRFVAPYDANFLGGLNDDDLSDYSEEYLKRLSETGTNGIWLHETLKNISEFPFDKKYSLGYEKRIKNLRKLTERCKKFGVDVYLYINEPRALPKEFFEKYPELKGQECSDGYCLCTSSKKVQDYLYHALLSVAKAVPLLKGVMTITMSENPTHCYSRKWDGESIQTSCERCKNRKPEEVAAELCNIYAKALKDGNGYTKLIANLWGWSQFMGWTDEMAYHGIELLDKDVEVLCVSEYDKEFVRGGVESRVIDYSISVVGPSDITVKMLKKAKDTGHKIWAKVQINNSWECAGVPYIPVFDLMAEHIKNVKDLNVSGLMMGWSLGGFFGGALPLCNMICKDGKIDQDVWYKNCYRENAELVRNAQGVFCEAFKNYPFNVNVIYFAGHNLGPANMWDLKPQNRASTMVCFTFDDYDFYTAPYGVDIYLELLKKLTDKWEQGLSLIENVKGNTLFEEFKRTAFSTYAHLKSAFNLTKFSKLKKDVKANKEDILLCIENEEKIVKMLYDLTLKDAKIGYEMTNHYFYNSNLLLEKLLNLNEIKESL